jgi:hypothetical protein
VFRFFLHLPAFGRIPKRGQLNLLKSNKCAVQKQKKIVQKLPF